MMIRETDREFGANDSSLEIIQSEIVDTSNKTESPKNSPKQSKKFRTSVFLHGAAQEENNRWSMMGEIS